MMCGPSCIQLEFPSSPAVCFHHRHVVEEDPAAIMLFFCDEDISEQL